MSDIEKELEIIAEWVTTAPNEETKRCIQAYDARAVLPNQRNSLKLFTVNALLDTLKHLKHSVLPKMEEAKKCDIVNLLLDRIKTLLPEFCPICREDFCVKRTESPLLICDTCGQGAHDQCITNLMKTFNVTKTVDLINPAKLPNVFYLCKACISGQNLVENLYDKRTTEPPPPEWKQDNQAPPQDAETPSKAQNVNICPFYDKGICRFGRVGRACNRAHPKPCQRLMKYGNVSYENLDGCVGEPQCEEYHPRICPSSLANRTCYNYGCKRRHLHDTRRHRPEEVNYERDIQSTTYENHFQKRAHQFQIAPPMNEFEMEPPINQIHRLAPPMSQPQIPPPMSQPQIPPPMNQPQITPPMSQPQITPRMSQPQIMPTMTQRQMALQTNQCPVASPMNQRQIQMAPPTIPLHEAPQMIQHQNNLSKELTNAFLDKMEKQKEEILSMVESKMEFFLSKLVTIQQNSLSPVEQDLPTQCPQKQMTPLPEASLQTCQMLQPRHNPDTYPTQHPNATPQLLSPPQQFTVGYQPPPMMSYQNPPWEYMGQELPQWSHQVMQPNHIVPLKSS